MERPRCALVKDEIIQDKAMWLWLKKKGTAPGLQFLQTLYLLPSRGFLGTLFEPQPFLVFDRPWSGRRYTLSYMVAKQDRDICFWWVQAVGWGGLWRRRRRGAMSQARATKSPMLDFCPLPLSGHIEWHAPSPFMHLCCEGQMNKPVRIQGNGFI